MFSIYNYQNIANSELLAAALRYYPKHPPEAMAQSARRRLSLENP
jgi:hypothetical protein